MLLRLTTALIGGLTACAVMAADFQPVDSIKAAALGALSTGEAAAGGAIALVESGDKIEIDIPERKIQLLVDDNVIRERREKEESRGKDAFTPRNRKREISTALKAYAMFAASADKGAVRVLPE